MTDKITGAPLDSYSQDDQRFFKFWYSHMKEEAVIVPPLGVVWHHQARYIWDAAVAAERERNQSKKFKLGDLVRKKSGSAWSGCVVGTYSTALTPEGYAVENGAHPGSVQIYPAAALELLEDACPIAANVAYGRAISGAEQRRKGGRGA